MLTPEQFVQRMTNEDYRTLLISVYKIPPKKQPDLVNHVLIALDKMTSVLSTEDVTDLIIMIHPIILVPSVCQILHLDGETNTLEVIKAISYLVKHFNLKGECAEWYK